MPPVRRLTDAEIEARLEQIRANNEARRAAPAPEPVTDARELPLRRVVPGDYITIPARNAYEVLRVTSSEPSGDGWHLRVVVDEAREEDVFMPGDTIATRSQADPAPLPAHDRLPGHPDQRRERPRLDAQRREPRGRPVVDRHGGALRRGRQHRGR